MKKVIIIGASGHSAEITDYITHYNNSVAPELCFDVVGYIDDNKESYNNYSFLAPYIGTIKDHEVSQDAEYIMGIANIQFRRTIIQNFLEKGARFATLIHPTAIISPSATVGEGCVVAHNASIGPKAIIGNFNMLKGDIELIEQGLADKLEQLLNVFLKTENYAEMIEVYYQIYLLVKPHHAGTTLNERKLTDSDERSRLDLYLAEIDESVDNDAVTNLVNSTLIIKRSIKPRLFYDVLDWKQTIFPELMNLIYDMK